MHYELIDDYCHTNYPKDLSGLWKENWYFNFIDIKNKAWGMNHISLERKTGRGIFRALHIIDEEASYYENEVDIVDRSDHLSDGLLSLEIIEPFKTHRLVFNGPNHKADIIFNARFAAGDYDNKNKPDNEKMSVDHYEQGMIVSGTIVKNNKVHTLSCYGHRDHTWGYRNENDIQGWRWAAINFDEFNMSLVKIFVTDEFSIDTGIITSHEGCFLIKKVEILSTKRDEQGVPLGSEYRVTDSDGRILTMTSERFSTKLIPMKEKKDGIVHENFARFTVSGSVVMGTGVDEYMEKANS